MAEVNVSSLSSSPDFQTSYFEKIQKTLPQVGCSLRCREILFNIPRILNQRTGKHCANLLEYSSPMLNYSKQRTVWLFICTVDACWSRGGLWGAAAGCIQAGRWSGWAGSLEHWCDGLLQSPKGKKSQRTPYNGAYSKSQQTKASCCF